MTVYTMLADGFEEVEALAPVDLLRRAKQQVTTVGVTGKVVSGSHGIPVTADITAEELKIGADMEMIVLPGGMPGTTNLAACEKLTEALKKADQEKRGIAAICAAPSVLGNAGLLEGKKATCYPGVESKLTGADFVTDPVAKDGNIITSRGLGTAIEFAAEIVAYLLDESAAKSLKESVVYRD